MKYIALTFDDGREDNVSVAYPIMARYGLTATLFVTTGYLDGTWTRDPAWAYSGEPITIDQLRLLRDAGWEIGLHGDWHRTSLEDWQSALAKLKAGDSIHGILAVPCQILRSMSRRSSILSTRWGRKRLHTSGGVARAIPKKSETEFSSRCTRI